MSNVTRETTTDGEDSNDDYDEMELTLALPGESRERKLGTKRLFSDVVYLNPSDSECSESDYSRKHVSKVRVVGWPPVRSYRKNTTKSGNCKYVKVAVDGAPYLRKVNLESYTSYEQLLCAFEDMISCFTILNEKMTDHVNRSEHVPIYEDKDGDWMLVRDVPWKMFVETCKRIRLMKRSEAINQLDPRTHLKS